MKANEKSILEFLECSDTSYLIPIYQRDYSWGIEEAKTLFDDLVVITTLERKHFLGSIVTLYNHTCNNKEYIVIDGQQRLVTISLLLIAVLKHLESEDKNANTTKQIEKLKTTYIINSSKTFEKNLKLKLKKNDYEEYKRIYERTDEEISYGSKLSNNYKYFLERIKNLEINIETLISSISKLYIIDIELILGEDNPQLIFESINSTGKTLTISDKIKNYIFMNLKEQEQLDFYNKYWLIIDENTSNSTEDFIQKFLYIKNINLIENDLYKSFKMYVANLDIKDFLNEIKQYSYGYKMLKNSTHVEVNKYLKIFAILDSESITPFLIELFKEYYKKNIIENQLLSILKILENFLFRRMICRLGNKNISRFLIDSLNISKQKTEHELLEVFKSIILSQKEKFRYPDFIEFKKNFLQSDLYRLGSKKVIYILNQIENYDNKELVDFTELIKLKKLSIEHIMPQRLNKSWKIKLGKDYKRIYQEYLHTIGNLTLTGYNSNMGNKTFQEKCFISKGFKQSRFLINKYIADQQEWNEKQIIERSLFLFHIILKIYPNLTSKIKLQNKSIKMRSLDEYCDYSKSKIKGFIFEGITYNSKTYKEMFNIIVSLLYDLDNLIFIKMASKIEKKQIEDEIFNLYKILSDLNDTTEILNYLYKIKINNNNTRILIIKNLFDLLNLEYENLVFYIQ